QGNGTSCRPEPEWTFPDRREVQGFYPRAPGTVVAGSPVGRKKRRRNTVPRPSSALSHVISRLVLGFQYIPHCLPSCPPFIHLPLRQQELGLLSVCKLQRLQNKPVGFKR